MTRMPPAALAREHPPTAGIVPPWLLLRVAEATDRFDVAADAARRSLVRDRPLRDLRAEGAHPPLVAHEAERDRWPSLRPEAAEAERGTEPGVAAPAPDRRVSDAEHVETLPGRLVRREGDPDTGDTSVDQAYDGLGEVYRLFHRVYGRDAIDGGGASLEATVHFGDRYDNAFWDGERMV
ncbi:MAG TPA: metalloprotease, partial [Agromyces sp.]|nr:metalloprotease [Agromyces sp.]